MKKIKKIKKMKKKLQKITKITKMKNLWKIKMCIVWFKLVADQDNMDEWISQF